MSSGRAERKSESSVSGSSEGAWAASGLPCLERAGLVLKFMKFDCVSVEGLVPAPGADVVGVVVEMADLGGLPRPLFTGAGAGFLSTGLRGERGRRV